MAKNKIKKINAFFKKTKKELKKKINQNLWFLPSGLCLIIFLGVFYSFFLPKDNIEKAKTNLLKDNPSSSSFNTLTALFLKSQNFKEVEKIIELAKKKQINKQIIKEALIQKQNNDPKEVKKQIIYWESVVENKNNYRDAYLKLATLYYKMEDFQKTKENLEKAKALDPNYNLTEIFLRNFKD